MKVLERIRCSKKIGANSSNPVETYVRNFRWVVVFLPTIGGFIGTFCKTLPYQYMCVVSEPWIVATVCVL
jgi:hypothetical protein